MTEPTVDGSDIPPVAAIGSPVRRREDCALITGDAEYTDDIQHPRGAHLAVLHSQYAHAMLGEIDTSAAEAIDGVLAVYVAEDLRAGGIENVVPGDNPSFGVSVENPILADGRVCYQGQPVAAVVAEGRYVARDGVEAIEVSYDRLNSVTGLREAVGDDAPTIHDVAPDNVAYRWEKGDESATERAFREAPHSVKVGLENNRVVPTAVEPRSILATYRDSTGELSVEMSTQNPHSVQGHLSNVFDIPDHKIRVRSADVGGGFGAKLQPYSGYFLAVWAAMQLDRPVKWVSTRTEEFLTAVHSRHQRVTAEVAVDERGKMSGLWVDTKADVGGYMTTGGSRLHTDSYGRMLTGQYDIPAAYVSVTGVFTNTTPISAYRGAGRPEASYVIERLAAAVARELNLDPVEVRRRNFIPADAFPKEVPLGHEYDSGDYEKSLDALLERVDYDELRSRQAELREEERYLGIGLSCYVEACGAAPGMWETGVVQVKPSGNVVVKTGTAENGQGHRTSYAQLVAGELGVPLSDIQVVEGDTGSVPDGNGTGGSRAIPVAGSAINASTEKVREKAKRIASHHFEASADDLVFDDGEFHVRGVPNLAMSLQEIAEEAYGGDIPDDVEPGLEATSFYDPTNYTFPFGTHLAVVEVTPETGDVEIIRYVAVDDVGTQVNPRLVEGQIHGGVVQGLGQALLEQARYDGSGNLATGSLQDYAMPRAEDVPTLETGTTVTESPHNPLGAKGVGEAGTIAAPPAVVNAAIDALAPLGIDHLDMPLSAESIWQATANADRG